MDEQAKQQVEAFMDILETRYGLDSNDIAGMLDTLAQLQKRSEFARKMGEFTAKAIIAVFISSFFAGLAWAINHFINWSATGT